MEAPGIEPVAPLLHVSLPEQVTSTPSRPLAHPLACETPIDPDLARLIDAWQTLPDAMRAGILAMVGSYKKF